ncbi:hypothetical protein JCM11491_000860 [Sporobolomyces phaffii]
MSSIRTPILIAARAVRPSVVFPRALVARSVPAQVGAPRLLQTSSPLSAALASSAGSGQGGKAEKEAAKKAKEQAKKEREQARKEREKERARKDKDRAKLLKEREKLKLQKEKDKLKLQKEKERSKLAKLKEKEKKPKTTSALRPPKAPTNSWGMFLGDFINERKRSLGAGEKLGSLAEVTKTAGAEYQSLDEATKAEYQRRADEQRAAYPAVLEEWKKTLTPEMIKEENAVRANRRKLGLSRKANLKIAGEPKRPKTAYFLFLSEHRDQGADSDVLHGETRILEQSRLAAAAWRALSESEKKVYVDRYEAARSQYEQDKADFDAKHTSSPSA